MLKKLKIIPILILTVALLSLFAYSVKVVNEGPNEMGLYGSFVYRISNFPSKVFEVIESKEVRGVPPTFIKKDSNHVEVNRLKKPLYLLNSYWNRTEKNWEFRLTEEKSDSLVHTWTGIKEVFVNSDEPLSTCEPRSPLITKDQGLIYFNDETKNLFRIDRNSNMLWKNDSFVYHHTLNYDSDSSHVFVCATQRAHLFDAIKNEISYEYRDELIVSVDIQTGNIASVKSISDILKKNYTSLLFASSDNKHPSDDPIHLNDIQPVVSDGDYMKENDLWISCRNKSIVFQYIPSTDSIIRVIQGPFINQHDIDIQNDSTITLFNNNVISQKKKHLSEFPGKQMQTLGHSNITQYNLSTKQYSTLLKSSLENLNLQSDFQGLHEILSSGRKIVELQTPGVVVCFDENDQLILYKTFKLILKNIFSVRTGLEYMIK